MAQQPPADTGPENASESVGPPVNPAYVAQVLQQELAQAQWRYAVAQAEVGQLRMENAALRAKLEEATDEGE